MTAPRTVGLVGLLVAAVAGAAEQARLENVKTEWQNAYGAIVYTVLADVKNVSNGPIQYVKVKVELLDKNGKVVAEREGYNVGAEVLEGEPGAAPAKDALKKVKPIPAGGTDHVRLSLDKEEIRKPFRTTDVVIVEAH